MADRSQFEVKLPIRGMLVGFIVIFALLMLATAATHFIPAGAYQRQSRTDERTGSTLEVVVPGSFEYTDGNPQGLLAFVFSPVKSLYYGGPVGTLHGSASAAVHSGGVRLFDAGGGDRLGTVLGR